MYKLCFYVPESHLETVKQALFAVGAGKIGDYDCCCWQTRGVGQYRPLKGSQPYQGKQDEIETADEYKVELVLEDDLLTASIKALKAAHPYEEVAFQAWQVIGHE